MIVEQYTAPFGVTMTITKETSLTGDVFCAHDSKSTKTERTFQSPTLSTLKKNIDSFTTSHTLTSELSIPNLTLLAIDKGKSHARHGKKPNFQWCQGLNTAIKDAYATTYNRYKK
ncbi:hypothetical protein [Vibrio barjaei]|uniref:hypothetical protein n=1 Tax=Vibrio barjaei TaxID=1676683 RepID=UPI0022843C89|nr:hypothetical protein [Vibrio barjaei]MCY9874613.1 hypothetical protein [Vibrio barjaei]